MALEDEVIGKLRAIIVQGEAEELVTQAEKLGSELGKQRGPLEITTNQIRAIFGTVRRIEMNWNEDPRDAKRRLILLKPKMRYRARKESRNRAGLTILANVLSRAIDLVTENPQEKETDARQRFTYFVDFFEAILAYHKVTGGQ